MYNAAVLLQITRRDQRMKTHVHGTFWRVYAWGEVTSQNLWPRHHRHFVGITWHNVWSKGAKIYRVI